MPSAYDVVIVGAGPAGSATAALLASRGQAVLLVDAATFPRPKACAEYISPGAVDILDRLGVFEVLDLRQTGRWLEGMRIVAPSGASHVVSYQQADGRTRAALSVPRRALDLTLVEVARGCGAEVRERYAVRSVWRDGPRVRGVVGPGGERIEAGLVVGADGLRSLVAHSLGVRQRVCWPRRLGLTAHLAAVPWPAEHGEMWVGRHGYVGVAPLDRHGLVSVGVVQPLSRQPLGPPMAQVERAVAEFPDLARRLQMGQLIEPVRGAGPLASRVRTCAGSGFALVGDAAGFFDPFTGEGIFRALRGAELLAESPERYALLRQRAFGAKERLTRLIQAFVQVPALMELAVQRLRARPRLAQRLGNMLGDLEPASLDVAWRLLAP